MDELISVVIPVYQVEKYLEVCVNSVQKQTYKNLEIILVDDGSSDGGPAICDKLAEQDDRIVVIHKENEGLAEARNVGISAAKGKYITFVDSDDSVDFTMIEVLYHALKNGRTIISACGYHRCKSQRLSCVGNTNAVSQVCDSVDYLYNTRNMMAWAKLYDKRIFNRKRFVKGQLHEDIYLIPQILMDCKNIAVVNDKSLYFYTQRTNSIMGAAKIAVSAEYSRYLFFTEKYAKRKYGEKSENYQKILAFCIRTAYSRLSMVKNQEYFRSKEFVQIMKQMTLKEWKNIIYNPFLNEKEKYSCILSVFCLKKGMELWANQMYMR